MNRLQHAVRYGPYASSNSHSHRQWEFGWYTQGRGQAWIGTRELSIRPGRLVCFPPQIPHWERSSEPFTGIFLIIDALSGPLPQMVFDDGPGGTIGQLCELMRSQFERPATGARRVPQLLFEALLVHLHGLSQATIHPLVERMQQAIQERSDDPGFRVAQASAGLPISRDHLRRLFIQHLGCTPVQYLRDIRIQRAQGLLAMGRSVTQSSRESGFDDPYYFSRVFRRVTGQPPSSWG